MEAENGGPAYNGNIRAAMLAFTGDWMWTTDTAHLEQNYKNTRFGAPICHRCGATYGGPNSFTNFDDAAPHWLCVRSNHDYLASPAAGLSPISLTPGWHIQSLLPELMHGGPLGYNLVVSGSVLKELCQEARFCERLGAGTWQEKMTLQLHAATASFKQWMQTNNRRCSHPRFTVRRLTLSDKESTPTLKAKAHNSVVVVEWLESVTHRVNVAHPCHSYYRDRATMVWGLAEFYRILRRSGRWLTTAQLGELKTARDATLVMFKKLADMAADESSRLYPCRPKMHVFDECHRIAQETGENPAALWTFQDEDNMRVLINIAQSCHGSTLEAHTLEKWCMQFFAGIGTDSENCA